MHAPMRRLMERRIVASVSHESNVSNRLISLQTPHTLSAPQTNLHLDILMGRDEIIEAADVFLGRFPHPYSSISS